MRDSVLVIGANGFVGRHILAKLAANDTSVIALTRQPLAAASQLPNVRSAVFPQDSATLNKILKKASTVINLASASTPGSSAKNPVMEIDQNLRPLAILLEALQSHPQIPFIHMSSGGAIIHREERADADEKSSIFAQSYHGAAKIAAENMIEAWTYQSLTSATIIRPTNIYGPGQFFRPGFGIIPSAFNSILTDRPLSIWGDGSATRDYIFIEDVIELLLGATSNPPPSGFEVYSAGSNSSITVNSLLGKIEHLTGTTIKRDYVPQRSVDPPRVKVDATKAKDKLNWVARTDIERGLEMTWNWFRKDCS